MKTETLQTAIGEVLVVPVPADAFDFHFFKDIVAHRMFYYLKRYGKGTGGDTNKLYRDLPSGVDYELLGVLSADECSFDASELIVSDESWLQNLLPKGYIVTSDKYGASCISEKGIDENDEEYWEFIFEAIKKHFGERFQEVYHHTNHDHKNFMVYFKRQDDPAASLRTIVSAQTGWIWVNPIKKPEVIVGTNPVKLREDGFYPREHDEWRLQEEKVIQKLVFIKKKPQTP